MYRRRRERRLLLGGTVLLTLGLIAFSIQPGNTFPAAGLLLVGATLAGLWGAHGVLTLWRSLADEVVLPIAGFVLSFGVIVQIRLSEGPLALERTSLAVIIGCSAFAVSVVFFSRTTLEWLCGLWPVWYLGGWSIYGALVVAGEGHLGSRYGPGLTTPGEIAKALLLLALAGHFARWERHPPETIRRSLQRVVVVGLLWIPPQLLLTGLRDFGTLLLMNTIILAGVYSVTKRASVLLGGVSAGIGLASLVLMNFRYVHQRFQGWFNPWDNVEGAGWQFVQGLFALNAGGVVGVGLGQGQPKRVPLVETDFVFAAVGEELGLATVVALLLAYGALVWRILQISEGRGPGGGRLLAQLVGVYLAAQVVLNVGGVIGLLPITGITLPLVSRGGTSLVAFLTLLGLAVAASEPEQTMESEVVGNPAAPYTQ